MAKSRRMWLYAGGVGGLFIIAFGLLGLLWHLIPTCALRKRFEILESEHKQDTYSMLLAPDNRTGLVVRRLSGGQDLVLQWFDLETGASDRTLPLPAEGSYPTAGHSVLAISNDGQTFAIGGWKNQTRGQDVVKVQEKCFIQLRLMSTRETIRQIDTPAVPFRLVFLEGD